MDVNKLNVHRMKKLYGREAEFSDLLETYQRVTGGEVNINNKNHWSTKISPGRSELVLISGYSGVGKSSLVDELRRYHAETLCPESTNTGIDIEEKKIMFFATGKFDLLRRSEPYSAMLTALAQLCAQMLCFNDKILKQASDAIVKCVGVEGIMNLTCLVPKLREVIKVSSNNKCIEENKGGSGRTSGTTIEGRNIVFRSFLRIIASIAREQCNIPLVFFLDDLQWGDTASLDLLNVLLTDTKSTNILFIGTYRSNEVGREHPLTMRLREIEKAEGFVSIKVGNLSMEVVNDLVSDTLRLDIEETRSLTTVIYERTAGNVFFVIRFLETLCDEKLLTYSFASLKWTWDIDAIQSNNNISDNVVDLMTTRLQKLPKNIQSVLLLAACFGCHFDIYLLKAFLVMAKELRSSAANNQILSRYFKLSENTLEESLGVLVSNSLIRKDSFQSSLDTFRFAHDRIHQAAYSLIPPGQDRRVLHMHIGELVRQQRMNSKFKDSTGNQINNDRMFFVEVDQLNIGGEEYITDPRKRLYLNELNLKAGHMAMASSAFLPASIYFNKAINLFPDKKQWMSDQYEFYLDLFTSSASADYNCGQYESSLKKAEIAIQNSRCMEDKMKGYFNLLRALRAQKRYKEALHYCLDLLLQLGETSLRHHHLQSRHYKLIKLRRMSPSDENLLNVTPLDKDDKNTLSTLFILQMITCLCGILLEKKLAALACIRILELTLERGSCIVTPSGYGCYADFLTSHGEYEEGCRYGNLALRSVEEMELEKSWGATVRYQVYAGGPYQFRNGHHIIECLDPILRTYEAGMLSGDIYISFECINIYCVTYIQCGLALAPLEKDMRAYYRQMVEYKSDISLAVTLPTWQYVKNLMGISDKPNKLNEEAMIQEKLVNDCYRTNDFRALFYIRYFQMELAYLLGDLKLASELSNSCCKLAKKQIDTNFTLCRTIFITGLIAHAMAKNSMGVQRRNHLRKAHFAMAKLKMWAEAGNGNVVHMLQLLNAENISVSPHNKTPKAIREAYDEAISTAGRNGFVNDKALANERAALFFLEQSNDEAGDRSHWASIYLTEAYDEYLQWGAKLKTDQLSERYGTLLSNAITDCHRQLAGTAVRGKSRFRDGTKAHKELKDGTGLQKEL